MLIDDNDDDNFYHRIIIDEAGIAGHVQVAGSGIEAIDYLKNGDLIPELIFLDINMPKMNGWEFLIEYNKLNLHQDSMVIIIMLTTSLNPADREHAKHIAAINGFETKPLTEEIINKIINNHFPEIEKPDVR